MLRVITISTDRKLFEENSAVLQRFLAYAQKVDEIHVVVFSLKSHKLKQKKIGNLSLYPTNSFCRWFYFFGAYRIGKSIIVNCKLKIENSGNLVISSQDPFETGLVGWLLKRKFKIPLQLQIHTDFLSVHFKDFLLNRVRVILAGVLIPKADSLRVVSKKIADLLHRYFPYLKIEPVILPVFVDVDAIRNFSITKNLRREFPQFTFIIFMASRLTEEKRIDIALRAFKRIVAQFPHTGLIIAGDGREKQNFQKLAEKLNLSKNVIFIGWQNDLISYYKTANMFLVTSDYEGYGMTIVEAVASDCPVVTTNVGIVPEILMDKDNTFVCPVGNEDCLVGKIMNFISDNSRREIFKRVTKDSMERIIMTKESYVNKYIKLLEDTVENTK